jgi:hypothetical protein
VVPADVLRYYGVAFFEKLRAKAKQGLAEMEAGGRIGGEPVEMEDDDEGELPFDVSELQTSGGDDADMQMAQMGMAQGGTVKMQEGGTMTQPATTFNPADWQTPGSTYFNQGATPQQQSEYRVYQNAQGQTISILFINGVAQQPIPEGYFPQGQAPKVEQPTPADSGDRDERPQEPAKSFNEYTAEDWVKYKPDSGVGSTISKIAGGVIGGAILGPAGALLGSKGMEEAMARNSIKGYNALNDFVANMNVNDPNYAELAKKRNDIFGELTAKQEEDPGLFTRIVNELFGTTEIAKPKGGGGSSAGGGGGGGRTAGGGGAASSRDEGANAVVDTSAAAVRRAAEATGAGAATRTAQDQKLGAGAREGNSGTLARSATSAATARSYKESVDDNLAPLAKGGLMVKKRVAKKAAKKRPIKTTDA